MIRFVKKNICLIFSGIILVYIAICDIIMTFSFSMNVVFFSAIILLLLMNYIINNPVDKKFRGPSFIRELSKVVTIFFFLGIISIIIFNFIYPKNFINELDQNYDYIIVFGAGISENNSQIMNDRIEKAIEYSKKYKRCKFVLTGAKGTNEPIEEAIYMKNYMKDRGVDIKRVLVDTKSFNTYENVYNSLDLIRKDIINRNKRENIITRPFKNSGSYFDLDFLNIGFMSSDFHMTRINMMAKKFGIYRPYDIICETRVFYRPYLYVREDMSLFKAFVLNQLRY